MNKTIIVGVIVFIVALGVVLWWARPQAPVPPGDADWSLTANSGAALTTEETAFDFGSISMAAGKVRHEFKIKNTSGQPVTIGKMYTSCMCTTAVLSVNDKKFGPYGMPGHGFIPKIGEAVEAEEGAIIEVIFNPAAHGPAGVGPIQRTITVENDVGRPLELSFTALVTP